MRHSACGPSGTPCCRSAWCCSSARTSSEPPRAAAAGPSPVSSSFAVVAVTLFVAIVVSGAELASVKLPYVGDLISTAIQARLCRRRPAPMVNGTGAPLVRHGVRDRCATARRPSPGAPHLPRRCGHPDRPWLPRSSSGSRACATPSPLPSTGRCPASSLPSPRGSGRRADRGEVLVRASRSPLWAAPRHARGDRSGRPAVRDRARAPYRRRQLAG